MINFKRRFRNIKKWPAWIFLPLVCLIKCWRILGRTRVNDPFGFLCTDDLPIVSVTWHNRLLFFPAMFPRSLRRCTSAMISASRDGQYLADVVGLFGVKSVRGSSSRGGLRALHGAFTELAAGRNVSITPDGPRGPRYRMSLGPIILASRTACKILPVSVNYSSYWEFGSWDRFQVPKPWARITLELGELLSIPADLDDAALEHWRLVVEKKLNEISMVEESKQRT